MKTVFHSISRLVVAIEEHFSQLLWCELMAIKNAFVGGFCVLWRADHLDGFAFDVDVLKKNSPICFLNKSCA